ncbi:hypothetical protein COLO4_08539 [Corchorus olitorius]|uniref:Uncharacterized protein n=1 Tax=Corchorus olitorius TaxID=93759 RepID=A0A1R3KFE6_9ROSI|nr:hypothetical protein COLO4_08539 [Corchorus olitorius]
MYKKSSGDKIGTDEPTIGKDELDDDIAQPDAVSIEQGEQPPLPKNTEHQLQRSIKGHIPSTSSFFNPVFLKSNPPPVSATTGSENASKIPKRTTNLSSPTTPSSTNTMSFSPIPVVLKRRIGDKGSILEQRNRAATSQQWPARWPECPAARPAAWMLLPDLPSKPKRAAKQPNKVGAASQCGQRLRPPESWFSRFR